VFVINGARRAIDWLFRDRSTGKYVVVSWPNLPLWVFIVARALEWLTGGSSILRWIGTVALLWWAFGELVRGVNPFRRILGGGVLVFVAVGIAAAL